MNVHMVHLLIDVLVEIADVAGVQFVAFKSTWLFMGQKKKEAMNLGIMLLFQNLN